MASQIVMCTDGSNTDIEQTRPGEPMECLLGRLINRDAGLRTNHAIEAI